MTTPKPILAFDTATPTARVAVVSPQGDCLVLRERTAARHSANLLTLCDEVLREAGTGVAGIGAVVCGAGPGSFTGLRVGLAVAKGLALPTGLPLVLVSSLDALACDLAQASAARLWLPCIDAGKGQVYARMYAATDGLPQAVGDADWVLDPKDLMRLAQESAAGAPPAEPASARSLAIGGTGLDRYLDVFTAGMPKESLFPMLPGPSAHAIARLGLRRLGRGESDDIETAVPRYGRAPDITRPKKALLAP
jgi:tRNA threonylcarbamoyladenosine biosynthesis protein TsaB